MHKNNIPHSRGTQKDQGGCFYNEGGGVNPSKNMGTLKKWRLIVQIITATQYAGVPSQYWGVRYGWVLPSQKTANVVGNSARLPIEIYLLITFLDICYREA
jgi:hypothetical protein